LSKVAQTVLDDFGKAVKRARSLRGWTLDQVAACITPPPGKSFLSNVEKGKRDISATTVGKLIRALDLPESWIDRFLDADIAPEDEETPKDREAERLIRRAEADPDAPETPEALLILLAEEWSGQRFTDPSLAYNALKGAIQTAAEMRAQGALPSNISAQFQAVLRRVSELNDAGQVDEADAALKDATDRHEAEGEALFEALLKQDRLRNRPEAAAKRHVRRLLSAAPQGGVFMATRDLLIDLLERSERMGDPFGLSVALELAKLNHRRAKKHQLGQALTNLGICYIFLGEHQTSKYFLCRSVAMLTEALKEAKKEGNLLNLALANGNLGNALRSLGEREGDRQKLLKAIAAHRIALDIYSRASVPVAKASTQGNLGSALFALANIDFDVVLLQDAIDAFKSALTVLSPETEPIKWALVQNNLGGALFRQGEYLRSLSDLRDARIAFEEALTVRTRVSAPMDWAATQSGLGNTLRALGDLEGDSKLLGQAIEAFCDALSVCNSEESSVIWAMYHCNLGIARRCLGEHTDDIEQLDLAEAALKDCLSVISRENSPFYWAHAQGGLAGVFIARYRVKRSTDHISAAQAYLAAARKVFSELDAVGQLAECDRLQAKINAA
jgi:tetratricopeptide (TPR) repeat protein